MHAVVAKFFADVRAAPEFIAAATKDPSWNGKLFYGEAALELAENFTDPASVERFERIVELLGDPTLSIREKCLRLDKIGDEFRGTTIEYRSTPRAN